MSCPDATAPVDIKMVNNQPTCEYKCEYKFQYNNSSCIATNRDIYISLSYDKSSSPPVIYNSSNYDVQEVRIYTPSLHSYSGVKADGELIIVHSSNTGAKPLLVCIPIKKNYVNNVVSTFFKNIVSTMANNANKSGESTTVNLKRYNLNEVIPRKPFFSYSATLPYYPCCDSVEYVVFELSHSLDILQESLIQMQTFIGANTYTVKTGPELFYNEKGPTSWGGPGGEIYIDCQPVGASDETVEVVSNSDGSGSGSGSGPVSVMDWINQNPIIAIILASLIFIAILYLTKKVLNLFTFDRTIFTPGRSRNNIR